MNTITIYPDKCKITKLSGESAYAILEVEYEYYYEGERRYTSDLFGVPEYEEIDIQSIKCEGDMFELLLNYTKTQDIINEIELKISEYERNN